MTAPDALPDRAAIITEALIEHRAASPMTLATALYAVNRRLAEAGLPEASPAELDAVELMVT